MHLRLLNNENTLFTSIYHYFLIPRSHVCTHYLQYKVFEKCQCITCTPLLLIYHSLNILSIKLFIILSVGSYKHLKRRRDIFTAILWCGKNTDLDGGVRHQASLLVLYRCGTLCHKSLQNPLVLQGTWLTLGSRASLALLRLQRKQEDGS